MLERAGILEQTPNPRSLRAQEFQIQIELLGRSHKQARKHSKEKIW